MATRKSVRLIVHSTPEKAPIVKRPLRKIKANDSVVVVNARTSSPMRWSGLGTAPLAFMR